CLAIIQPKAVVSGIGILSIHASVGFKVALVGTVVLYHTVQIHGLDCLWIDLHHRSHEQQHDKECQIELHFYLVEKSRWQAIFLPQSVGFSNATKQNACKWQKNKTGTGQQRPESRG